jgi:hypothetical protein
VAPSGSVRASVAAQDKYASGSGKLSLASGAASGAVAAEVRAAQDTGRGAGIKGRSRFQDACS